MRSAPLGLNSRGPVRRDGRWRRAGAPLGRSQEEVQSNGEQYGRLVTSEEVERAVIESGLASEAPERARADGSRIS